MALARNAVSPGSMNTPRLMSPRRWVSITFRVVNKYLKLQPVNAEQLQFVIGPDGMEKFCEDIGVEPENIVMLVLAYKMGATQMGFFSQQEWLKGLTDLECDSTAKMVVKLDYLRSILNDPNSFKSIYRYAYDFAKVSTNYIFDCVFTLS